MAEDKELVPVSIVQLIFNQVKQSVDQNTTSIKELTVATNDLVKYLLRSPTRKDLAEKIESLEDTDDKNKNSFQEFIEKCNNDMKVSLDHIKESSGDITNNLININKEMQNITKAVESQTTKMDKLINVIKTFLVILSVAATLIGGIHWWVDRDIEDTVKKNIGIAVEQIIKSRPYNKIPIDIQKQEKGNETKEIPD